MTSVTRESCRLTMSVVSTSTDERQAASGSTAERDDDLVIDLRDGLESMRGIVAAMALSAPVWIGVAVITRRLIHRFGG